MGLHYSGNSKAQSYRPDIKFFAAPWAPPAWMKSSGVRRGQTGTAGLNFVDNSVKPEYYKSYANYLVKYIQEYEKVELMYIRCLCRMKRRTIQMGSGYLVYRCGD
ncbi:MAG: hypothetical protein ACLTCI_02445 [[Clostridium] nexile]